MADNEVLASTRSALVLYGTETGNSQDLAYELSQSLQRHHFATSTRELDAVLLQDLVRHDLVAFSISTTGQGDFPSNARKFWLSLLRKRLPATALRKVTYALVGLCDSSYPKFNLAARKLDKRLKQLGATSLLEPCEADEQGDEGTEGAFLTWLPRFEAELLALLPLPVGLTPIPRTDKLPSAWTLAEAIALAQHDASQNGHRAAAAKISLASPEPTFGVVLEDNIRVTPVEHWQDVRLLKLRAAQPVTYMPGDALAIMPENLPSDIEELIKLQGWQKNADIPLVLHHHLPATAGDNFFDCSLSTSHTFTLRELFIRHLDINAVPRRSFFAKIAHFTQDDMQKERALEFADPQYLDEYFDYATRPRRSILEVLQEFDTVKIPWQEAINVFPMMRPRQFSIASGGRLKQGGCMFELLAAIVKYRTVIKRVREGVCTRYLARLPVGSKLNVVLHTEGRFHLQSSGLDRQHLLVGAGTGIAPLRSIIYEKLGLGLQARSTLFFGCRNARADYFFDQEWARLEQDSATGLKVLTAFSRDQESKVYIQDRLRENASLVRGIVNDPASTIVVCGSSGPMPKAVRQAIKDALTTATTTDQDAEELLARFEKEGRYRQETW